MAWTPIVGRSFTPAEFDAYVRTLVWTDWKPSFIVLHNTASPSLSTRPEGLSKQHILNLERFYRVERKWSGSPHLFIDDHQIWVMNPLTVPGVHSPSWNRVAIGIEMLGNFDVEPFTSGRGLWVRANTIHAVASLSNRLGFKPDGWKFHLEDPKTTHDCPGKLARANRDQLKVDIASAMGSPPAPSVRPGGKPWDRILRKT